MLAGPRAQELFFWFRGLGFKKKIYIYIHTHIYIYICMYVYIYIYIVCLCVWKLSTMKSKPRHNAHCIKRTRRLLQAYTVLDFEGVLPFPYNILWHV